MKVVVILDAETVYIPEMRRFSAEWRHIWVVRIVSRILGRPWTSRPGPNGNVTVDDRDGVLTFQWHRAGGQ